MKSGLLGRKLGHSYSPQIHNALGSYSYGLFEKQPEKLEGFLKSGDELVPQYRDIAAIQCLNLLGEYLKEKRNMSHFVLD